MYRGDSSINIPAVSLARVGEKILGRPKMPLRSILRHEYAHALVDIPTEASSASGGTLRPLVDLMVATE
jgi:hypothetical protein